MDSAQELKSPSLDSGEFQGSARGAPRWLVVVVLNMLILGELTWSMYLSHGAGEDTAWVFLKSFIPMVLSTLFLGKLLLRRFFPN